MIGGFVLYCPSLVCDDLGKYFQLKQESISPPKIYLGGHCQKDMLENGVEAWGVSASQYMSVEIKNVEKYLSTQEKWRMPRKANTLISTTYQPELDISPELNSKEAA